MPEPLQPVVRWIDDLGLDDRASVGGKGASLGELTRAGIPVPPGFVILTDAFDAFLDTADPDGKLRGSISKLDHEDVGAVAALGRNIRLALRSAPVPPAISEAIVAAYSRLSPASTSVPVAVRSSATCEDSAEASFAGLQDTYLWTLGADALVARVRDCWASLYNDESISYRLRLDIPESQLSIAVVVQEMIDSQCAGVMFTRSPLTGDRSVLLVEGSWGLGSCLVSGEVTPDKFVINKVTGEIDRRDVSAKTTEHVPDRDAGGTVTRSIEGGRRERSCLDDDALASLWQLGRKVEQHYGSAQDIEWAIARADDKVYILQSRPETVWSNREQAPAAQPADRPYDHVVRVLSSGRTAK
jgi:pyruvate,water dikinase